MTTLESAVKVYRARRLRLAHPRGEFDRAGRWYPSDTERQLCCAGVRAPSRAYPYSLLTHCRSARHVAHLYNISVRDLLQAVQQVDAASLALDVLETLPSSAWRSDNPWLE